MSFEGRFFKPVELPPRPQEQSPQDRVPEEQPPQETSQQHTPSGQESGPPQEAGQERVVAPEMLINDVESRLHNVHLLARALFVAMSEAADRGIDFEQNEQVRKIDKIYDGAIHDLEDAMHNLKRDLHQQGISLPRQELAEKMKLAERDGLMKRYDPEEYYGGKF